MRRVFVHVGLSKAASTTLQAALSEARPALSAAGAAYPAFGSRGVKDQRFLFAALAGEKGAARAVRRALAPLSAQTLIVSGETLFKHPPQRLRALLEDTPFAAAELTAVAIVREPVGWLNSRYAQQATGFRQAGRFAAFARAETRRTRLAAMFRAWQAGAAFVALPLADRRDGREVVARAFAAMGLAVPPPPGEARKTAADPRAVEAGRRVAATRLPGADPGPARRRLAEAAQAAGWDGRFVGPTPTLARDILARTAADRDRFARAVWAAPWDAVCVMPDPDSFRANEWAGGAAADEAAIAALVQEVAALLPRRPRGLAALFARPVAE